MNLILGNNNCLNCDAALIIHGNEVFRLRERAGDGRLVIDFDLRGPDGERIATVAKNNVVFGADGFELRNLPRSAMVVNRQTGDIVAEVREESTDTVRVIGEFWTEGRQVLLSESGMTIDGVSVDNCTVMGFGTAVEVTPGAVALGVYRPSE